MWKETGFSEDEVRSLYAVAVSRFVAAFLINYDSKHMRVFKHYKDALAGFLGRSSINGAMFTDADEEERKALPGEVMKGLQGTTGKMLEECSRIRAK